MEVRDRLEDLLDEIECYALNEVDGDQAISNLLKVAKKIIDIAEQISSSKSPVNQLIDSSVDLRIDDELDVCQKNGESDATIAVQIVRRSQELHINPAIKHDLSQNLYKLRRIRDKVFGNSEMFGEPAWDMLLDLMIAERKFASISVTSVCIASCVPPTTALRWLAILEFEGLVDRTRDALDRRRSFVRISEKGQRLMNRFFAQLIERKLI